MEKLITLDVFLNEMMQPIINNSMDNNPFYKKNALNKKNDVDFEELGKKYKKLPYSKDKFKAMQKLRAVSQVLISIGGVGGAFRTIIGVLQKVDDLDLTMPASELNNDIDDSTAYRDNRSIDYTQFDKSDALNELSNKNQNIIIKKIDDVIRKNNFEKIYTLAAKIDNDPTINKKLKELKNLANNESKAMMKIREIKDYINKNYTLDEQKQLVNFINKLQKDLRD